MNFIKICIMAATAVLLWSCSSSKTIPYFQDLKPGESELTAASPLDVRILPDDKLSILVSCQDQRLASMFNLMVSTRTFNSTTSSAKGGTSSSGSNGNNGTLGYTVDSKGNIDFPVIGEMHVEGMTREGLEAYVKNELKSRDLIKDPTVTVEFMNTVVNVLGEVGSPGRYSIDRDRYTILDALSDAGDLTINGKRENVMVVRNENGTRRVYGINLCSAQELYSSPAFYLQQNDVVYVEPNKTKALQSTINGTNLYNISFWMSLTSFITSFVILLTN